MTFHKKLFNECKSKDSRYALTQAIKLDAKFTVMQMNKYAVIFDSNSGEPDKRISRELVNEGAAHLTSLEHALQNHLGSSAELENLRSKSDREIRNFLEELSQTDVLS
ncbi:hypothetical protein [Lacticaseibacillus paracasei]|uniref:hypothetical protein n=1 Tax=Lacticaseibacillus paracasei TaxID=1597 RepID=UPI0009A46E32|nr:hypothetical protein [Lacticaseibacillus paracasei]OPH01542.1 hypothetical protein B4586_13255 [Lacticaseibacillus paracasei]